MKRLVFTLLLLFSCVFCMAQTPIDTIQTQSGFVLDTIDDYELDTIDDGERDAVDDDESDDEIDSIEYEEIDATETPLLDTIFGTVSDTTMLFDDDTLESVSVGRRFIRASYYPIDISFDLGTHFYLGEHDKNADFKDWWAFPAINISATYWLSHCWGIGADVIFRKIKGLSWIGDSESVFSDGSSASLYGDFKTYTRATGSYIGLIVNGCFDVTSLSIHGVYRNFRLVMYMGVGGLLAVQSEKSSAGLTIQGGFRNQWTLSSHWDIDFIIQGSVVSDRFEGEYQNRFPFDITMGAMIGVTYKLW